MSKTRYRDRRRPISTGVSNMEKSGSTYITGKYLSYVNGLLTTTVNAPYGTSAGPAGSIIEKCWDELHPGPPYNEGGNFSKLRVEIPSFGIRGKGILSGKGLPGLPVGTYKEYKGGFTDPSFTGDPLGSENSYKILGSSVLDTNAFPSLTSYASSAFAKTMPSIQEANVSQFLYEFREVPRMLQTTARGFRDIWKSLGGGLNPLFQPKELADHFLNVQFGWLPFIKDLRDIKRVWENSAQYMSQKKRDNGRWIRRSRMLETTESSERVFRSLGALGCTPSLNFNFDSICPLMTIDGVSCRGYYELYLDQKVKVWSEGSFKYYRPEFDDTLFDHHSSLNTINRYLTLYGARVNPAVVYKVTPWTWLINWFANVGDNIDAANAIGLDGMVSRYLYVMHMRDQVVRQRTFINAMSGPHVVEWERKRLSKQRQGASSPYGFSLTWGNLNPKQLTILAALGITRA